MVNDTKLKYKDRIFLLVIVFLLIFIVKNPLLTINAARDGLNSWFNILVPSLLPFMILSDILISSGLIGFFGKYLEPIMGPLFNVSGQGAFPFIISSISGYPMGAKLVAQLRLNSSISKLEADRLITFSSTSGPLFILGSVAIGMLNNTQINSLLIIPHFLGAITIGLFFRFYRIKNIYRMKSSKSYKKNIETKHSQLYPKTLTMGAILANSIRNSINSLILIGGFVTFYSVIIEIIFNVQLVNSIILIISKYFFINNLTLKAILSGVIELVNGCKNISSLQINLGVKILCLNFIIGWGGLSIHSQALSFISETDINQKLYLFSKFLHGIFSVFYTYLFLVFKYKSIPVSSPITPITYNSFFNIRFWISSLIINTKLAFGVCIYFLLLNLIFFLMFPKEKEA